MLLAHMIRFSTLPGTSCVQMLLTIFLDQCNKQDTQTWSLSWAPFNTLLRANLAHCTVIVSHVDPSWTSASITLIRMLQAKCHVQFVADNVAGKCIV